jgi:hypothetical protein
MEFAKLEKNWAEHQQAKTVLAKSSSQRSYFMVHVHVLDLVHVPVELQFYSCTTNDGRHSCNRFRRILQNSFYRSSTNTQYK